MAVRGLEKLPDVLPRALELRRVRRRHAPDHPQRAASAAAPSRLGEAGRPRAGGAEAQPRAGGARGREGRGGGPRGRDRGAAGGRGGGGGGEEGGGEALRHGAARVVRFRNLEGSASGMGGCVAGPRASGGEIGRAHV